MSRRCIPAFALLFSCQYVYCYTGDPVVYLPPFEVRPMKSDRVPGFIPNQQFVSHQRFAPNEPFVPNQQFIPNQQFAPNQQFVADQQFYGEPQTQSKKPTNQHILHTKSSQVSKPRVEKEKQKPADSRNYTFSDILEALNTIEDKKEISEVSRASDNDYQHSYGYGEPSNGYSEPPYGYHREHNYPYHHEPPHPTAVHPASKVTFKSGLGDIVKPVATKVAGKVSGLIGLVLALLTGSAPNDPELKGFADIVINGIVKPLLVAKGGIKSLISKLTIPVISLLLINLEVLITIWWLWEDCQEAPLPVPVPLPPPVPYHYPSPHSYHSYR